MDIFIFVQSESKYALNYITDIYVLIARSNLAVGLHVRMSWVPTVGLDALTGDLHLCIPAHPGGGKGEEDHRELHDGNAKHD